MHTVHSFHLSQVPVNLSWYWYSQDKKKDSSLRKGIFLWKAKTCSYSMCLRVPLGVQILFLEVSTDGKSPSNFPSSKQRVQHRHFQLHVLPQGQSQYLSHSTHIYPNNAWLDSSLHDIHNLCFQSLSHTSFLKLSRALHIKMSKSCF